MKKYIYEVENRQRVHLVIWAEDEEESLQKLNDMDFEDEELDSDDYQLDEAELIEVKDIDY